jgi:hypothetical protein
VAQRQAVFAGEREAGLACRAGEQAVVADAVEAARQNMKQEAPDELVSGECHDLLSVGSIATIVLVVEGDASLIEADEPAVRDGDPMVIVRLLIP